MKNHSKYWLIAILLVISPATFAWQWLDLWQTPDQQGKTLLQQGKAKEAATHFNNKQWQAVAHYRSGDYTQAFDEFSAKKTSDDQYNAGNAAAYSGKYAAAIAAYEKALALNAKNTDAKANRDIIKKLMEKQKQQSADKSSSDKKKSTEDKDQNSATKNDKSNQQPSADNKNGDPQKKPSGQANKPQDSTQSTNNTNADANNSDKKNPSQADPNSNSLAKGGWQNQDEEKKQLMRRLADNPGGLLRQKFMRDYLRRHPDAGAYSQEIEE